MFTFRMLSLGWAVLLHATCCVVSFSGELKKFAQAETMYVVSDEASTFAGPSAEAYATGQLKRGSVVEVYGSIDDQWCAVRPPVEQYDWLAAQYAHLLPGGHVAEVVDTPTPAWIHSDLTDRDHFMWQVKLQPTQQVNVRGQFMQQLPNGRKKAWYKIEPPPGEFRWMEASVLSKEPPRIKVATKVDSLHTEEVSSRSIAEVEKNATPTQGEDSSEVKQASGSLVSFSEEPYELAPGEYIVDGDVDHVMDDIQSEGSVIVDEGFVGESVLSDGGVIGEVVYDGTLVEPCATCGTAGTCSTCVSCSENILDDRGYRLKPVSKFLGMFGLALVEAERPPPDMPCATCGLSGCTSCASTAGITQAASIGGLPSRLDALPRPTRRMSHANVDQSLLIDRLGDARTQFREGIQSARSRLSNSTEPLLPRPAAISLGAPLRNNANEDTGRRSLLSGLGENWQGLSSRKTDSAADMDIPELDVQGPTSSDTQWQRLPAGFESDTSSENSSFRATSSPGNGDQSQSSRLPSASDDLRFKSIALQQAASELTSIVSRPTEQWQLNSLRQQVQQWIETGSDPIARGEARLLLDRIEQFETFRSKWLSAHATSIAANVGNSSAAPTISMASFQSAAQNSNQTASKVTNASAQNIIASADASGWLVSVHSDNPTMPAYALTDKEGRLVAYIEATPGINLRNYIQQPIAVFGQRGTHTLLNARMIRAQNVVRVTDM